MKKHPTNELPIRSKLEMAENIGRVINCLFEGDKTESDRLIEDLKTRSVFLDQQIQQDVLIFCEQIQFQIAYDPMHSITPDIQKAADKLIEDLGFTNQNKYDIPKQP